MGFGTSIVLIAVGAILKVAVTVTTTGFDLQTTGVILMIVGIIGLLLSIMFWSSWGGFRQQRRLSPAAAAAKQGGVSTAAGDHPALTSAHLGDVRGARRPGPELDRRPDWAHHAALHLLGL